MNLLDEIKQQIQHETLDDLIGLIDRNRRLPPGERRWTTAYYIAAAMIVDDLRDELVQ